MNFAKYLPSALQGLMPGESSGTPNQMPQDDTMMQLELQRRMKFADALRNQEAPQGQMVSGIYVAPSWTQQLSSLANKYVAGKNEENAMQKYGDYQAAQNAKLADLLKPETQLESSYNESGSQPMITETQAMPDKNVFLAKALQARPDLAPKLLEMQLGNMFTEEKPMVVAQGGRVIDKQGNLIYENPKEETSPFAKINPLEATAESLAKYQITKNPADLVSAKPAPAPVTRNMRQGNQDITQQWNPEKNQWVTIATGNAFKPEGAGDNKPPSGYRWGANGTLEPIKGGPADKPLKSAPPTVLSAYQGNNQSVAQLDEAITAVQNAPDKYFGLEGQFGDAYMQRRYPGSTDVRSKFFKAGAAKRHDITGAAMSITEAPDLRPFIPSATDTKEAALTKLRNLRSEVAKNNAIMEAMYGDTSIYAPLPKLSATSAAPAGKTATKKYNPATGKVEAVK